MSIVWFRKCLRIHDNPSLVAAVESKLPILPIFILDPKFVQFGRCGVNRWNFLFQSLADLHESLSLLGSSLTVFRGNPTEVLEKLFSSKEIKNLYFEKDTEPYAKIRDASVEELCKHLSVNLKTFLGHTLYDPNQVLSINNGITPLTYNKFLSLIKKMPEIKTCTREIKKEEILNFNLTKNFLNRIKYEDKLTIPKINELMHKEKFKFTNATTSFIGGEKEGLRFMNEYLKDKKKVRNFLKPQTIPTDISPASTTRLSPYLKFGCVSIRRFYHELNSILEEGKHSEPPCSLLGQLYWREFFYCGSVGIANFHKMKGNKCCKVINWRLNEGDKDKEAQDHLQAWAEGRTGYPWIDAVMTQLREEGWIHHLARHSVACFLTRGDLYINWEKGQEVFEELLIDADYALNAGNWLWLSGTSSFFTSYFRIYSPVTFPKKYDAQGSYVRHFLPVLKNLPKEYIYEPWKAPMEIQEKFGCVIGRDYPHRIVIHEEASQTNLANLSQYFGKGKPDLKPQIDGMEPTESAEHNNFPNKSVNHSNSNAKNTNTRKPTIENITKQFSNSKLHPKNITQTINRSRSNDSPQTLRSKANQIADNDSKIISVHDSGKKISRNNRNSSITKFVYKKPDKISRTCVSSNNILTNSDKETFSEVINDKLSQPNVNLSHANEKISSDLKLLHDKFDLTNQSNIINLESNVTLENFISYKCKKRLFTETKIDDGFSNTKNRKSFKKKKLN